jgi:RHS repeat-associated protein
MTNAAKAAVWDAVWLPWGAAHSITGTASLNARFPGQWFQSESGLHYNWHRHYDPSLGSYTQPDPLGFIDGPSVYGYAGGRPQMAVDLDGRNSVTGGWIGQGVGTMTPIPGGAWVGRGIGMAVGAGIAYYCAKKDPQDDALNRCLKAADGSDRDWTDFCTASRWFKPVDPTRSARCHDEQHSSPTRKKGWCYTHFGR